MRILSCHKFTVFLKLLSMTGWNGLEQELVLRSGVVQLLLQDQ